MNEINVGTGIKAVNNGEKKPFEPLPKGEYVITADRFEMRKAKSGFDYLSVSFKVKEGEHKGRLLWENFSVNHPKVGKRAVEELEALVNCCGRKLSSLGGTLEDQLQNISSLSGKDLLADIEIKEQREPYKPKNVIKSFKAD